jgi:hypothetical protein
MAEQKGDWSHSRAESWLLNALLVLGYRCSPLSWEYLARPDSDIRHEPARQLSVPDLVVPVQPASYLIMIAVFLGAWQLARGGLRSPGWSIAIVAFCFVAAL